MSAPHRPRSVDGRNTSAFSQGAEKNRDFRHRRTWAHYSSPTERRLSVTALVRNGLARLAAALRRLKSWLDTCGLWSVFGFATHSGYQNVNYRGSSSIDSTVSSDGSMVENCSIQNYSNLVDWSLSGTYDPDRPVLIDASDPSRFVSRRKATNLIARLAGAFEEGSTVCLHLPNDVLYPVLLLGILASKCTWSGTNPAYTHHELEHHFRISNTRYVVTLPENLETVETAVRRLDCPCEVILFSDILKDTRERNQSDEFSHPERYGHSGSLRTLYDILQCEDHVSYRKRLDEVMKDDIAVLMSTSGTTGQPKMAARTHQAYIQETKAAEDSNSCKPYEVRRLFCTPIFHAFSTPEMVFNPLRLGYPTYFMKRFDDTFAQKVHDFEITETAAPPPMLLKLQQRPENFHLLQSLRLIFCGGAPLADERRSKTLEMFDTPPRIVPVWGMTEGGWFSTLKYPEDDPTNSVGQPLPGYEVKVGERDEIRLDDGRVAGELFIKGPQLMTGYLGNAKASENVFSDGWLKTGDIGYLEDGKIYIVDRAKDLIKVNGWQVAPAELESALLTSPHVLDAAAISVGCGVDEHPMVFVVPRSGIEVSAADVEGHLRTRLARYKVAYMEVHFVDAIPRNPSGKILKKILREQAVDKGLIES